MSRPGWRRSGCGQLTKVRPLALGIHACSSSCWWYARIRSRLVQAGGGGGATHECGSGDTGSAHALARRRGEGTTSQHFERYVYMRVGEGMGGGGGVDLQAAKAAIPKAKRRSATARGSSSSRH